MPRPPDRALVLAGGLAVIAGYVDAIGFTRLFGVFPANQSGNVVLLGIGIGDLDASAVWRPALAVVAFGVGVAAGMYLRRRGPGAHASAALLGLEAGLLVLLAAVAGPLGRVGHPVGGATEVVMLTAAAAAMGIQTDVIRRASGVTFSTTYQSGAIDRIAVAATDTATGGPEERSRRAHPGVVLVAVLATYIGGAAVGAAAGDAWNRALWVPAVAAVVLFSVVYWRDADVGDDPAAEPGS